MRFLMQVLAEDRGETAIEYALIAALISVSIIAAATQFSDSLSLMLTTAAQVMTSALN